MSHHFLLRSLAILMLMCVGHCCHAFASDPVSIESLLSELIDRDSAARFPKRDFRLKQQSSYNRASKTPDDEKGWFNNKDNNTSERDKNFIRIEENSGKQEWVLMEDQGPGAIVRKWMPFRSAGTPDTNSQIRIYLDDDTVPTLEGNMLGLFNGTGLIPYPLAHKSLRSAVSFFPIPYARRCKVTTTEQPFFYQITFREYADGTPVKTFSMDDFKAASAQTAKVGETLLKPTVADTARPLAMSRTLAAKEEMSLELPRGTGSIRELSVKLGSYENPMVTRAVVLKMEFDGHETVWCPIGDFFGTGIGLNPFQDWYRTVDEDGTMKSRWVMPYQNTGNSNMRL